MDTKFEEIVVKRYIAKTKTITAYEVFLPITLDNKIYLDKEGYEYELRDRGLVVTFWDKASMEKFKKENDLDLEEFESVKREHYHSCV